MSQRLDLTKMRGERMIAVLKKHDAAYYNQKPVISDAEYDTLRQKAQRLLPKHPYFKTVGASLPKKIVKEKLPIMVGSLSKLRPTDVPVWCKRINATQRQTAFRVEPKWDGASLLMKYEGGKLVKAWRRGEGDEGGDVTATARHIQGVRPVLNKSGMIDCTETILVRAEVVMHRSIFNEFYGPGSKSADLGKEYSTPRNLANGLLNRIDAEGSKEHLGRCTAISYYLFRFDKRRKMWVRPTNVHVEWLYLSELGFTTSMNPTRYSAGHKRIVKNVRESGNKQLLRYLPVHEDGGIGHLCKFEGIPTPEQVVERLNEIRKAVDVPIDGLVIQPMENATWQKKGDHLERRPSFVQSIKLDAHDQDHIDGVIGEITSEISKRGLLKPVVVMKDGLNFDGVEVTNASASNYANVVKWGLRPGRKVRLVRSGDVIPRVVGVFTGPKQDKLMPMQVRKRIVSKSGDSLMKLVTMPGIKDPKVLATLPTKCPACGTKLTWTKNRKGEKIDLHCANAKCPGRHGKSVLSFFRTLGVDDVAAGTIDHLINAGFTTVQKILRGATAERLIKLEGYQARKAEIVSKAIAGTLKDKPLPKVMHASGIFSSPTFSMGSTKLQDIVDHVGVSAVHRATPAAIRAKLSTLKGIGPAGVDLFANKLEEWRKFYDTIKDLHTVSSGPQTLAGIVACFTGFRDAEIEKYITGHGGRVAGMSSKVNVLFAASVGSAKCAKAEKLGIPVVAQSQAWGWIKERGRK